jgi:DHA2 family multidrug resistance protein
LFHLTEAGEGGLTQRELAERYGVEPPTMANLIDRLEKEGWVARKMDWSAFDLLFCAIGGIQILLDRGNSLGWFTSTEIKYWALMSSLAFIGFVWHSLGKQEDTLFDIRILADRNFTASCALSAIFGLALYGTMMVQHLMHYPPTVTGWLMTPRGLASMVSMLIAGRLVSKIDARMLIVAGILVFSVGARITTNYSINLSPGWIVLPAIIQGFGLGLMLVSLSTIAFSTLPQKCVSEA